MPDAPLEDEKQLLLWLDRCETEGKQWRDSADNDRWDNYARRFHAARPLAEISDLRHRVRRLHWFRQSFTAEAEELGRRYGFAYEIDDRALVEAFFHWASIFERERVGSTRNRRDFAVFAGGLMLRELCRANPARSDQRGQFDKLIPPDPMARICEFWPEGFLYTTYCLTLVRAILEQDFDVHAPEPPQLEDLRVWQ